MARKSKKIAFCFGEKHKEYIRNCTKNTFNFAEGAVRAGKTVDNVFAFAHELKTTPDKIHRGRVCQDTFCGFSKLNDLSVKKSPKTSCLQMS